MSQRMKPKLRFSISINNITGNHEGLEDPMINICMPLNIACAVGKDKIKLPFRTLCFPILQRAGNQRRHRNSATNRTALGNTDNIMPIRTLPDMNGTLGEVYLCLKKPSKLAGAHSREQGSDDTRGYDGQGAWRLVL